MDIRYALLLIPLTYVLIPYFLTGSFIILGGVSLFAFISGVIIFAVISNLNIGGGAQAIASGGTFNLGLNSEGGYTLFVIVIGGLFYIGAQVITFVEPITALITWILNALLGVLSWLTGADVTFLQTNMTNIFNSTFTPELDAVYPLGINIAGISIFGALDIIMGCLFILGLYFMVSSRGK